jgi:hypothetical protein
MDSREWRKPFQVVLAIAALLIIAATLTLRTVAHPAVLQPSSDNPTPLGYTWSLLLFIIPIGALGWWFASRPDLKFPRAAFGVRSPSLVLIAGAVVYRKSFSGASAGFPWYSIYLTCASFIPSVDFSKPLKASSIGAHSVSPSSFSL